MCTILHVQGMPSKFALDIDRWQAHSEGKDHNLNTEKRSAMHRKYILSATFGLYNLPNTAQPRHFHPILT